MKYIHIGYPKNLSTTLQRDFFSQHPNLLHLGIGCGSNIDYIDHKIEIAAEEYLIYAKYFKYKTSKFRIKQSFKKWFDVAEKENKTVGLSLELLSFTFSPDQLDLPEKARRLYSIFGKNTKILMIIRNQSDLLKSMYREYVRIGYIGTFNEYIKYLYMFQDRSFLYDFMYHFTYNLYKSYFGIENIKIIVIENVRDNTGELIYNDGKCLFLLEICNALEIPYYEATLNHYNPPLTDTHLMGKIKSTSLNPHDLSNPIIGNGVNSHRLKSYFNDELKLHLSEKEIYRDVIRKAQNIESSIQYKVTEPIDYSLSSNLKEMIADFYIASNIKLEKLTKLKLPANYFNI